MKNKFISLPRSLATKPKLFKLPLKHNNVLVLSDLHFPFQDNKAIRVALNYGLQHKINSIVINGDLLDFFMISRFVKLEDKPDIQYEIDQVNKFLDKLNSLFPKVHIYFLLGNHDKRLKIYLSSGAKELKGLRALTLEELLDCKGHKMTIIDDNVVVKLGKLAMIHGHQFRSLLAPVNPARGLWLRAKASCVMSHVHRVSSHNEVTINNKTFVTYSTGCLCELNPDYAPFANNYTHGFGHCTFDEKGLFNFKNIQVLNGKIVN